MIMFALIFDKWFTYLFIYLFFFRVHVDNKTKGDYHEEINGVANERETNCNIDDDFN